MGGCDKKWHCFVYTLNQLKIATTSHHTSVYLVSNNLGKLKNMYADTALTIRTHLEFSLGKGPDVMYMLSWISIHPGRALDASIHGICISELLPWMCNGLTSLWRALAKSLLKCLTNFSVPRHHVIWKFSCLTWLTGTMLIVPEFFWMYMPNV